MAIKLVAILMLYKVISLLCGVFICYLGYRLFIQSISYESGELSASWNENKLIIRKAAPGTFFSIFGALIIIIALYRGFQIENIERIISKVDISSDEQPKLPMLKP